MNKFVSVVAALFIGAMSVAASPHQDKQGRLIKALSPDRIHDLETGAGAGYALAAELNGYPGPRHVLDLADTLQLTADQRRKTASLFRQMKAEAIGLGKAIIKQETALEALFQHGRATENAVVRLTSSIGAAEARLRATHLKYHLIMADMMTQDQRTAYDRLRGYGGNPSGHRHQPSHH